MFSESLYVFATGILANPLGENLNLYTTLRTSSRAITVNKTEQTIMDILIRVFFMIEAYRLALDVPRGDIIVGEEMLSI